MFLHSKKSCHWQIKRKNERKITNHVWNHLLFLIYFDFWALSKFEKLSFCFLDSNAGRLNQIQVRLNDGKFSIIFEWFERILIINLALFLQKTFLKKAHRKKWSKRINRDLFVSLQTLNPYNTVVAISWKSLFSFCFPSFDIILNYLIELFFHFIFF